MERIPNDFPEAGKGTYILILHLPNAQLITVGKHGAFPCAAGWYAYVGSAFGAGGLRGRLKHHLAAVRKPHWHIDYLRQHAQTCEIWYSVSEMVHEHQWAAQLQARINTPIPIPRFGASDCKCPTHLIYFPHKPLFEHFRAVLSTPLQKWDIR